MVSELATNSIRHAGSDFTVILTATTREVRVEVTDNGAGAPAQRRPSPSELSGRGLLIVDKLAERWGVRRQRSGGKTCVVHRCRTQPRRERRRRLDRASANGVGQSAVVALPAVVSDVEPAPHHLLGDVGESLPDFAWRSRGVVRMRRRSRCAAARRGCPSPVRHGPDCRARAARPWSSSRASIERRSWSTPMVAMSAKAWISFSSVDVSLRCRPAAG